MKKLLFILMFVILCSSAFAATESLGTFKQNECISLLQICSNCTYNNITSVKYPNSSIAVSNKLMSKSSTEYNYTFCDTSIMGTYIVNGVGDLDTEQTVWSYDFFITEHGSSVLGSSSGGVSLAIIIVLICGIALSMFLMYSMEGAFKLSFLLIGVLGFVFLMHTIAELAVSVGASINVQNTLWVAYNVILYCFWALFLYVLWNITFGLMDKKNIEKVKSPLDLAKERRKRTGKWQ